MAAGLDPADEDSIERLKYAWEQFKDSFSDLLAGPLGQFIEWLTAVVNGLTVAVDKVIEFGEAFSWIPDIIGGLGDIGDKLGIFGKVLGEAGSFLLKGPLWYVGDKLADIGKEAKDTEKDVDDLADGVRDLSYATDQLTASQRATEGFGGL